jgi:hypothetical protein
VSNYHFRIFEHKELAEDRRHIELIKAMDCAKGVLERYVDPLYRRRAVNDLLYYAWEERNAWREPGQWSVSDEQFRELLAELDIANEADISKSYEQFDTLCRAHAALGDTQIAASYARMICDWLENAATRRSDQNLKLPEPQHGPRWVVEIMRYLRDDDEKDSLAFALELLHKAGERA